MGIYLLITQGLECITCKSWSMDVKAEHKPGDRVALGPGIPCWGNALPRQADKHLPCLITTCLHMLAGFRCQLAAQRMRGSGAGHALLSQRAAQARCHFLAVCLNLQDTAGEGLTDSDLQTRNG